MPSRERLGASRTENGSALLDPIDQKLVVAAIYAGTLGLFRCELDGTGCTQIELHAGEWYPSPHFSSPMLMDVKGATLVIVAANNVTGSEPGAYRCHLDGTACTYTDFHASPSAYGWAGSALIDSTRNELLVLGSDDNSRLTLFSVCLQ